MFSLRELFLFVASGDGHNDTRDRERPHDLASLYARLTAKISLNNFCIGFNPPLQEAEDAGTHGAKLLS